MLIESCELKKQGLTIEQMDVLNGWSFPSPRLPPLQSESKCEVFVMVIRSTLHMNEN